MVFLLLLIAFAIFIYFKNSKNKKYEKPVEKTVIKEEKLTIDEEIALWTEKNKADIEIASLEIKNIEPKRNVDGFHVLSICEDCFSLFSIEEICVGCPTCSSNKIAYSDNGKLYSGKWFKEVDEWAISKDSAHPLMVINRKS